MPVRALGCEVILASAEDARILAKPVFPDGSWTARQLGLDSAHWGYREGWGGGRLILRIAAGWGEEEKREEFENWYKRDVLPGVVGGGGNGDWVGREEGCGVGVREEGRGVEG